MTKARAEVTRRRGGIKKATGLFAISKKLLALLLLPQLVVHAQEKVSLNLPLFADTITRVNNNNGTDVNNIGSQYYSYRQNVCDRYRQFSQGQVELRFALEGLQLHTAAAQSQFFRTIGDNSIYHEDIRIDPKYPGLAAVLMDELASRGRFSWRDSFAVYDGPGDDKTWSDLLYWTIDNFDVSADWWIESLDRLKAGATFPHGWYKGDFILVAATQEEATQQINMFVFLEPFTSQVWYMIVATLLASALIYQFLEFIGHPDHKAKFSRNTYNTLGNSVFHSILVFTQHFQFKPKTPEARMFGASLAVWSLLISSAYTANLASFFIIDNTPQNAIVSIEDVTRAGLPICVFGTTATADYVQQNYPKAFLIKKAEEVEIYEGVNTGECAVAVTTYASFQEYSLDKSTNPECRLRWVGRVIEPRSAGFATLADSATLCTSLIYNVLHIHFVEMERDGFVEKAWADHFSRINDAYCAAENQDSTENSSKRTVEEMAGTFIIHAIISMVAIVLAICHRFYRMYRKKKIKSKDPPDPSTGNSTLDRAVASHAPPYDPHAPRPSRIDMDMYDAVRDSSMAMYLPNPSSNEYYDPNDRFHDEQEITVFSQQPQVVVPQQLQGVEAELQRMRRRTDVLEANMLTGQRKLDRKMDQIMELLMKREKGKSHHQEQADTSETKSIGEES